MSNQPKTPHRTIRVGGSLWKRAQEKAAKEGTTVSDVIRAALEAYVERVTSAATEGHPGCPVPLDDADASTRNDEWPPR